MRIRIALTVLLTLILLTSCDKNDDIAGNIKQIRIDLYPGIGTSSIITGSQYGNVVDGYVLYQNFNLNNYKNCKSITLNACMESSDSSNDCILELYNITDNEIINNSTITTSNTQPSWINSDNLINQFPDKDIDLSLKIKTESSGVFVQVNAAYLYIEF